MELSENWMNWLLVIGGIVCMIVELMMGAITGFDLALLGTSMTLGGAIGLAAGSTRVGLFSAGALAFIYLVFCRRWVRKKLTPRDQPSNVDAIIGKTGVVTMRIAPHAAGQVKVRDEIWRAELVSENGDVREPGEKVTVDSIEGVTLKVR